MVQSEGNMSLKNSVTPPGIDPGTVRLVAQRLNHYATTGFHIVYVLYATRKATDTAVLYEPWRVCRGTPSVLLNPED
jgi:hypothetical protein